MIKINNLTTKILKILNGKGRAYIVGGYIRDKILGIKSSDIDIATNLPLNTILELLKEFSPRIHNYKYQIINFKVDNTKYEIVRMREETGILDGRNPKYFSFTSVVEKDLIRRDFTINAIAYNNGVLLDKFNGLKDIENKKINIIGDAKTRFFEDKTRILRCFKFMAKLDFELSDDLHECLSQMSEDKDLFKSLSNEKLLQEFNSILKEKYAAKALYKMYELNFLKYFIAEFDNKIFSKDKILEICDIYNKLDAFDLQLAYASIFVKSSDNINDSLNIFKAFSKRFLPKNPSYYSIKNFIKYSNISNEQINTKKLKRILVELADTKTVSKLIYFNSMLSYNFSLNLLEEIQKIYLSPKPTFLADLDISNSDLYTLNLNPKYFLDMKKEVLEEIEEGNLKNNKYDIVQYLLIRNKRNLELIQEQSAGAIVYTKKDGEYRFLIICGKQENSFGFAKGHIEKGELEHEAAIREVKEETNIDISLIDIDKFKYKIGYIMRYNIYKMLTIYLAEAKNTDIKIDEKELDGASWLSYKMALKVLKYSYQRELLKKAMLYILI